MTDDNDYWDRLHGSADAIAKTYCEAFEEAKKRAASILDQCRCTHCKASARTIMALTPTWPTE